MPKNNPVLINGWAIYAHPLFLRQLEDLNAEVKKIKSKDPLGYQTKNITKIRDAVIIKALKEIPADPTLPKYRQGNTLGNSYTQWFRAKFYQQYRLFFRYSLSRKIIIYGWVNDRKTLRAYGSKTDAYAVFKKMLDNGNPPSDWKSLLAESETFKTD